MSFNIYEAFPRRFRTRDLLPTNVVLLILTAVQGVDSLRSVLLVSKIFHSTFLENQPLVLRRVTASEVDRDILPDALLAHAATKPPRSGEDATDFLQKYKDIHSISIPSVWSMADCIQISRLGRDVDYLTTYFQRTLTTNPVFGAEAAIVLSKGELVRIKRAFYRYSVYCSFYGYNKQARALSRDYLDAYTRRDAFFGRFSPWENEQFVTIYEFLQRCVSKGRTSRTLDMRLTPLINSVVIAYDEVAMHDVQWGEWNIPYSEHHSPPPNRHKEFYSSLGLNFLCRLNTASTYDEYYKLLSACSHPKAHGAFMYPVLEAMDEFDVGERVIGSLRVAERDRQLRRPCIPDGEGGARVWEWAYRRSRAAHYFGIPELYSLRKCGYIFYDHKRMRDWKMHSVSVRSALKKLAISETAGSEQSYDQMIDSWKARSDIWMRGGLGYWAEGDESRIVWSTTSSESSFDSKIHNNSPWVLEI